MSASSTSAASSDLQYYAWEEVERDLDSRHIAFSLALTAALDTPHETSAHPYDERSLSESLDLFQRRQRTYHDSIERGQGELRDVIAEVRPRRARALAAFMKKTEALLRESGGPNYSLKRLLDILIGALTIVVLSPVLAVIAIAIKLESKGPIFYRSLRIGSGNLPFTVLRFRTMKTDVGPQAPLFAADDDPRLTGVGRYLRRTSLNELPQLWNVLRGDMSLIGPQPLPPTSYTYPWRDDAELAPDSVSDGEQYLLWQWHAVRLLLKPGLTGPWVLYDPPEDGSTEWARIEVDYFRKWSVGLDLKILAKSVPYAFRPHR